MRYVTIKELPYCEKGEYVYNFKGEKEFEQHNYDVFVKQKDYYGQSYFLTSSTANRGMGFVFIGSKSKLLGTWIKEECSKPPEVVMHVTAPKGTTVLVEYI